MDDTIFFEPDKTLENVVDELLGSLDVDDVQASVLFSIRDMFQTDYTLTIVLRRHKNFDT